MSRVNTILGMILSFVFIMAGSQKITDVIHPDTHAFLANGAKSWGPIWAPHFRTLMTTLTLDEHTAAAEKILLDDGSKTYGVLLKNIGYAEVVCAAMLLVSMFSGLATVILSCIMAGAVYTHMQLDEPYVPPAVLLTLLIIKLILPKGSAASSEKSAKLKKKGSNKGPSKKD